MWDAGANSAAIDNRARCSSKGSENHSLGGAFFPAQYKEPRYVVCTAPTTHAINASASRTSIASQGT